MRKFSLYLSVTVLFSLSSAAEASYQWPTKEWSTILPSQVGMDPQEFERFLVYTFPEGLDWGSREGNRTEALVIIKDGHLVYERYERGFHRDLRHIAWSMTKLVLNALTGIAEKKNLLKNSDTVAGTNIKVKDLLAWSSGLDWSENYEYNPLNSSVLGMLYGGGMADIPKFVSSIDRKYPPGTYFNYSSGDSNLLMRGIRDAVGEKAYPDFPWKELFDKIGMKSAVLERDLNGNFVASSYMHATARDIAKLGLLYLNDGVWNKERILPEGWIYSSRQIVPGFKQTSLELKHEVMSPGYHLWVNRAVPARGIRSPLPDAPDSVMAALGHWGQSLWILPSERMVVVRMADDRGRHFSPNRFLRLLLNAFPQSISSLGDKKQ